MRHTPTGQRRTRRIAVSGAWLGLAAAGGAAWILLRPAPAPPPVVLHPTAAQVTQTEQHLTQLGQAATQAKPGPRTLRVSETDLNVTLAASKPVHKLLAARGVEAVQIVLLEPNRVVIHASVRVQGRPQNVQISGTLSPDPKTGLRFTATSAQAGRFPLPQALVNAQASRLTARFFRPFLSRLALTVQRVSVDKKELVLVGISSAPASPTKASPPGASPAHR